ncbi:DUF2161 domain-containing phosphodiesterase [Clostridium sp. YIM B02551]|uniref:DUF2161 domain-containing phosphodiesterase n=1 Tax=Clostridium sp. YIM B02551 TaxID=2910679 RepID=UPI001EEAC31C|nr:DUF2161 family putative PD-(D/E)XK-type phosphodiesterase [Clostridium sp. YIM B02551]
MSDIVLERDMYIPVRDFFISKGYEVRSEVNNCDVCAMKGDELIIIELKKNLSVDLLVQGAKRQKTADLVYIAIPKPKKRTSFSKWRDICHLIKRLELGLILVSSRKTIEIAIHPEAFDRDKSIRQNKRKRDKLIKEFNGRHLDMNVGGSTGEKLMTSYKEDALYIACCLHMFGPLSAAKLKKLGADAKKTYSIVYNNHYGWFEKIEKGVYSLTDEGVKALTTYKEIIEILKTNIQNFNG